MFCSLGLETKKTQNLHTQQQNFELSKTIQIKRFVIHLVELYGRERQGEEESQTGVSWSKGSCVISHAQSEECFTALPGKWLLGVCCRVTVVRKLT